MANEVIKDRGELYSQFESVQIKVGCVEDVPQFVVMQFDNNPDSEILFSESETRQLIPLLEKALKMF